MCSTTPEADARLVAIRKQVEAIKSLLRLDYETLAEIDQMSPQEQLVALSMLHNKETTATTVN